MIKRFQKAKDIPVGARSEGSILRPSLNFHAPGRAKVNWIQVVCDKILASLQNRVVKAGCSDSTCVLDHWDQLLLRCVYM